MFTNISSSKTRPVFFAVILGAVALWMIPGLAAQAPGAAPEAKSNPPGAAVKTDKAVPDDATFAKQAAQAGIAEIKFAQLAQQKSEHPAVKDFAQRMITDHTKLGNQLKAIATADNISLPDDMSDQDQQTYDMLMSLGGEEFNRIYAQEMIKDHKEAIADFQREAKHGTNASIRNFASKSLPTLQSHLHLAEQMQTAVATLADYRVQ